MQVVYGHQILSNDDPHIKMAEEGAHALSHCGPPGGTPVDLFPLRLHILLHHCESDLPCYSPILPLVVPWYILCYEGKGVQPCRSEVARLSIL